MRIFGFQQTHLHKVSGAADGVVPDPFSAEGVREGSGDDKRRAARPLIYGGKRIEKVKTKNPNV